MSQGNQKLKVFISHSSSDDWIARKIADKIEECGGKTFLDHADIDAGDRYEDVIRQAAQESTELIVLLTPHAISNQSIWAETGAFWVCKKRFVIVVQGMSLRDVIISDEVPFMVKDRHLIDLNQIDLYLKSLCDRVARGIS